MLRPPWLLALLCQSDLRGSPLPTRAFTSELSRGQVASAASRISLHGICGLCRDRTLTGWIVVFTGCDHWTPTGLPACRGFPLDSEPLPGQPIASTLLTHHLAVRAFGRSAQLHVRIAIHLSPALVKLVQNRLGQVGSAQAYPKPVLRFLSFQRVAVQVKVRLKSGGAELEGETIDVSLNGTLIRAPRVFPLRSLVEVKFYFIPETNPVVGFGSVMRIIGGDQMGVRLDRVPMRESMRLQEYLLPLIPN